MYLGLVLVAAEEDASLDRTCCGIEANPNLPIEEFNNAAGIAPGMELKLSAIFQ